MPSNVQCQSQDILEQWFPNVASPIGYKRIIRDTGLISFFRPRGIKSLWMIPYRFLPQVRLVARVLALLTVKAQEHRCVIGDIPSYLVITPEFLEFSKNFMESNLNPILNYSLQIESFMKTNALP